MRKYKYGKIFFVHFNFHLNAQNVWKTGWERARFAFPDFPVESPLSPFSKFPRNGTNSGNKRQEVGKNPQHRAVLQRTYGIPAPRAENPTIPKKTRRFCWIWEAPAAPCAHPRSLLEKAEIRPWKLLLRAQRASPTPSQNLIKSKSMGPTFPSPFHFQEEEFSSRISWAEQQSQA